MKNVLAVATAAAAATATAAVPWTLPVVAGFGSPPGGAVLGISKAPPLYRTPWCTPPSRVVPHGRRTPDTFRLELLSWSGADDDPPRRDTVLGADDRIVQLNVGGFTYTTTRGVLQFRSNYFRGMLSESDGDGNTDDPIHLDIPDRHGRVFFYVLYYLQLGELPRGCYNGSRYETLLPRRDLLVLNNEAEHYDLEGLVELCQEPLQVLGELGSIGDFDFDSGFYWVTKIYRDLENDTVSRDYDTYSLEYECRNGAVVEVWVYHALGAYAGRDQFSVTVKAGNGAEERVIVDMEKYCEACQILQDAIAKLYYDSGDQTKPTVSQVLAKIDQCKTIVPLELKELRLWWAMEVFDLVEYFDKRKDWNYDAVDDALHKFLWLDRSWRIEYY